MLAARKAIQGHHRYVVREARLQGADGGAAVIHGRAPLLHRRVDIGGADPAQRRGVRVAARNLQRNKHANSGLAGVCTGSNNTTTNCCLYCGNTALPTIWSQTPYAIHCLLQRTDLSCVDCPVHCLCTTNRVASKGEGLTNRCARRSQSAGKSPVAYVARMASVSRHFFVGREETSPEDVTGIGQVLCVSFKGLERSWFFMD